MFKNVVINKPSYENNQTTVFTYYSGTMPTQSLTTHSAKDEWIEFNKAKKAGYNIFLSRCPDRYLTNNVSLKQSRMASLMSI